MLLPLALTFLPNNWWEEVAWQGFVQARLQDRRGPVMAAVLTGVLFALQHIALVAGADLVSAVVLMLVRVVLAIPFRFLTGWVYIRTSSLFLVGLLHAMSNAVTGGSGFHPGLLARLYPEQQVATTAHLFAFFALGLVVLAVTRGRLGSRSPVGSLEAAPERLAGPGTHSRSPLTTRPATGDRGRGTASTTAPPRGGGRSTSAEPVGPVRSPG
ncbi:CPBP family intramembrane glutamic endopeptidase [Georgenia sp. M64]|uniref:CPBP family intramembrane glutamic endopeptidase n=1 Tax=Georgenia sp. M64 TaxID=3120520 RepID=UPI0030E5E090